MSNSRIVLAASLVALAAGSAHAASRNDARSTLAVALERSSPSSASGATTTERPLPSVSLTDAVLGTLNKNPTVMTLRHIVEQGRGNARSARGKFDWTAFVQMSATETEDRLTDTELLTSLTASGATRRRRNLRARISRRNRDGVVLEPFFNMADTPDRVGAPNNVTRSEAGLAVIVPLRRGKGRMSTVTERAAQQSLKSTELRILYEMSVQVLNTVVAHNDCLAALQSVALNEDIVDRAEAILSGTKDRIKAGLLEPAFIHQTEAKFANNKAGLVAAENSLYTARQRLAFAMGLSPEELLRAPLPSGDFPDVPDSKLLAEIPRREYLERVRENRLDYRAVLATRTSEEIRLQGDIDNTRALIDLRLQASFTGLGERSSFWGRQSDAWENSDGPDTGAFLTFQFPLGNNAVRGRVDARRASVKRQRASAESLLIRLSANCLGEIESLRNAARQYELVQAVEKEALKAVDFERDKYQAGNSRLNLVIILEDQYIRSRLTVLQARRRYSNTLARMKFAIGALLLQKGDEAVFRTEDLHRISEG